MPNALLDFNSGAPFTFRVEAALALALVVSSGCGPTSAATPAAVAPAPTSAPTPLRSEPWVVEDFEEPGGKSGGIWFEFDKNRLGTVAEPNPFGLEAGGAQPDSKHHAHIRGTLGANRDPWTWVQLQLFLDRDKRPQNLNEFKSLRFFAKGDGGRYGVALVRQAVKNFDHFHYEFTAPSRWTEFRVPLEDFVQSGWAEKLPRTFDDVTTVQFYPAVHEKPFDVAFDDVQLSHQTVTNEPVAYDTRGWFPWAGTDADKRKGTALDVSRLLDAPAGKHGPLRRQGDRLVFRNGKPARFWGVNIVASANFPSHAEADKLALLLSQLGVNMTRHHHIDAAWSTPNVFGNQPGTTELDAAAMERFDYFVAQLQKRGIYQYFDLLVHRKPTAADGVEDAAKLAAGLKIEGEFSAKLIQLQQRFVEQFLGHENQYTARRYADEPAVALLEIINEDSLLWLQPQGEFALKTQGYRAELERLFSAWLSKAVPGGRAALAARWGSAAGALLAEEDPVRGNVAIVPVGDRKAAVSSPRASDTLRFLYETQLGYYRQIQAQLEKLGFKGLVTGSNHWVGHPLDLYANSQLDFVDRHAYWSHPEGGWGYSKEIAWDPSPMVKDVDLGIVGSLARRRVKGAPYAMSEWQTSAPNDYRVEGPLLMAAFASFADAHPLEFAFSHDSSKRAEVPSALNSNFDLIAEPAMLAAWPAASLLFHRRDVTPSQLDAFLKLDPKELFSQDVTTPIPNGLALVARTGVDFAGGSSPAALEKVLADHKQGNEVSSSTGQLKHDAALGQVRIDTPRSQGVIGFSSNNPVQLTNATVAIHSAFSVVTISSLDDAPIAASKRLLLSALGNAVNTGMALTASGNRLAEPGQAPVLVEPIRGVVTLTGLSGALTQVKVYALGSSGERLREVAVSERGAGSLVIPLSQEAQTLHYEISR